MTVDAPTLSVDRPVEEVARVELHARLIGGDLEGAAARRLDDARGARLARSRSIENEVVIVSTGNLQLLVRLGDPRTDGCRRAEIERRAGDRRQLTGRNQRRVDGRVTARVELQQVTEDVAPRTPREIEVTVLRQVDRRCL